MTDAPIRIGTRASELALRQAAIVQEKLLAMGFESELVAIKTLGDRKLDQPLPSIGGKGLFTKELETALLKKRVDICVHSLKDLPTELPAGLIIAAMLEREDPRDVLVVGDVLGVARLEDIPAGSRVGTSSLRRRSLLLSMRPDLEVAELRGNVPTRLRKVDGGQVHAAVLAAAGLHRLDAHQHISQYLEPPDWLPAAGQGIIAVQTRADDSRLADLVARMHDGKSGLAARAERAFLEAMDGGCQVPIGALALRRESVTELHGFVGDASGRRVVRGMEVVQPDDPERSGRTLAASVRLRGGEELVHRMRELADIPAPQPE
jgi:hydroxymethylbilane synthase